MKKKGFTLIELLAVIVILAIIALIATPLVLKYIETSRIESFKVSVENIKDSALKYVANEQLNGKVTYPVTVDVKDLDFKGKEDYTGKVIVYKDGTAEEFIEKENYRSSNGGYINKKNEPYLKIKEGKTATIDDKNKLVYSFWNNEESSIQYRNNILTLEILESIFEVGNGTLEIQKNDKLQYSTGAKLIVKDNDGNVYIEYKIVIFGDPSYDGMLNQMDYSIIKAINSLDATIEQLYAADVNRDKVIDETDINLLKDLYAYKLKYNQITNKFTEA